MNDEHKTAEQTKRELLELLGAAWDGRLDATSFARLEELLRDGDRSFHEVLIAFSQLQVDLVRWAASSQSSQRALESLAPYFVEASSKVSRTTDGVVTSGGGRIRGSVAQWPKRRLFSIAAGLLLPLAALVWYWGSTSEISSRTTAIMPLDRAPRRVARFVEGTNAVWTHGSVHDKGDLLPLGQQLHLLQGTAQISMISGADILLQAPCWVELVASDRVRLHAGNLTAQAAHWAKGFTVVTSELRVTDLGTRFAMFADAAGVSEVHVLEGIVEAEPLRKGEHAVAIAPLMLRAGQAVRSSLDSMELTPIKIDSGRFVSTLPNFQPLYPINIANTGQGLRQGYRDNRWRIAYGHFSGGKFPTQAMTVQLPSVYLDNQPDGSQWISVPIGTSRGVAGHTQYTFETTFQLDKVDPATVHLVGQVLVDNRIQEIRLNGKPTDVPPWEMIAVTDFQKFHVIDIREGFTAGTNRLEFDVINSASLNNSALNPMALRVEWQAFGCATGVN